MRLFYVYFLLKDDIIKKRVLTVYFYIYFGKTAGFREENSGSGE